jgi:hypothetical protein
MGKHTNLQTNMSRTWLAEPQSDHRVHFYALDDVLLASLTEYFYEGLLAGETCIAIATPSHLASLNAKLRAKGVDLTAAIESNQYIMLDASTTLSDFMVNDLPEYESFLKCIGRTMSLAAGRGRQIRAFGEMVSILWERNNLSGLLQLEKYWHGLVNEKAFSLYCAYPKTLFGRSNSHKKAIDKICNCHTFALS